jgi:hypothetical protein
MLLSPHGLFRSWKALVAVAVGVAARDLTGPIHGGIAIRTGHLPPVSYGDDLGNVSARVKRIPTEIRYPHWWFRPAKQSTFAK